MGIKLCKDKTGGHFHQWRDEIIEKCEVSLRHERKVNIGFLGHGKQNYLIPYIRPNVKKMIWGNIWESCEKIRCCEKENAKIKKFLSLSFLYTLRGRQL